MGMFTADGAATESPIQQNMPGAGTVKIKNGSTTNQITRWTAQYAPEDCATSLTASSLPQLSDLRTSLHSGMDIC
jgi:hypothetical protein